VNNCKIKTEKFDLSFMKQDLYRTNRNQLLVTITQLVKKFPAFYGNQRLITVFAGASYPRSCIKLCNKLVFYDKAFLAPRSTCRLEDYPMSAVRYRNTFIGIRPVLSEMKHADTQTGG
jgi:hypothetical protein